MVVVSRVDCGLVGLDLVVGEEADVDKTRERLESHTLTRREGSKNNSRREMDVVVRTPVVSCSRF